MKKKLLIVSTILMAVLSYALEVRAEQCNQLGEEEANCQSWAHCFETTDACSSDPTLVRYKRCQLVINQKCDPSSFVYNMNCDNTSRHCPALEKCDVPGLGIEDNSQCGTLVSEGCNDRPVANSAFCPPSPK